MREFSFDWFFLLARAWERFGLSKGEVINTVRDALYAIQFNNGREVNESCEAWL